MRGNSETRYSCVWGIIPGTHEVAARPREIPEKIRRRNTSAATFVCSLETGTNTPRLCELHVGFFVNL